MKRLLALVALALCMSAPSFGADVVGHSVKAAGKGTHCFKEMKNESQ